VASGSADLWRNPVTEYELAGPTVSYQAYVTSQLAVLAGQTASLQRDLDAGNEAAAKAAWLDAHLTYHRMGAAYEAFGDLGRTIDGRAAGLPGGTADPSFTGFHRVELLLWSEAGTQPARAPAAALAKAVATLQAEADTLEITDNTMTRRAHEILEDTLRIELTGQDDYGSHTDLATATADLAGTRTILELVRSVLNVHAPGLAARIDQATAGVQAALAAAGPAPVAVAALPRAQRERLDASVDAALEDLARVPGVLLVTENE
jgi:iron uptake system component EfeO